MQKAYMLEVGTMRADEEAEIITEKYDSRTGAYLGSYGHGLGYK